MQLYSCVVMACATNLYTIRINTDFYIILGQKYGLPFQNCGMYVTDRAIGSASLGNTCPKARRGKPDVNLLSASVTDTPFRHEANEVLSYNQGSHFTCL